MSGFEVAGTSAVVTGAAGGIGAAVAEELVSRGADRVLITDVDADRLAETADRLGVAHLAGDVTDEGHLRALLDRDVDLYVANAGVFRGFGLGADEEDWSVSWDVNVMAHVRAARLLVPRWVEQSADGGTRGCFVSTASAAGLLVQLGSATYTVSKHAALGFAEWLAATYGDQGVQVTCLCPMGVRTPMVEGGELVDDPDARLSHAVVTGAGPVLEPSFVADVVLDAVAEGRFLALPHPEVDDMQKMKADDRDGWLTAMQHVRRAVQ